MQTLNFYGGTVNDRALARAVEILDNGGVIIYPTDSLYALGCDALNSRAIERLCAIKGLNPERNLLSIVCDGLSMASDYARIDNRAFRILKEYTPGPVTFILPSSTRLPKVFKGRKQVGIRIPDNEISRALAEALGRPLLTTSVAIDDTDEVVMPESIAMHYEHDADALLDGGIGSAVPSTIVDLTDSESPEVIREGPVVFG